jgi:S1-C subfamily serine protease
MDDLLEFGVVQRGLLGIQIRDVTAELSKEEDLDVVEGVYVATVNPGSGAEAAGIKAKDVIIGVDGQKVRNTSRLQELVAIHRPGDKVEVVYLRDGKEKSVLAMLKNTSGTVAIVERTSDVLIEGALFEEVTAIEKQNLGIDGGVKLVDLGDGKWRNAGFEEGFIITHIDKQEVTSVAQLKSVIAQKEDERVVFLGVFPDGTKSYFSVDW